MWLVVVEAISGSIPACAGEPRMGADVRTQDKVYPRVCGGTVYFCNDPPPLRGLSPRVRGNLMHGSN